MKKIYLSAVLVFVSSTFCFAQTAPRFSAYSAPITKVKSITVDLKSHKDARMFRTNLRNAAKKGVNFAGHFVLTGWGCGTNCSVWAIIDARTGKVFFPKEFGGVGGGLCELPKHSLPADAPKQDEPEYPDVIISKPNSRLVVLNGYSGGDLETENAKCGTYYYEWTGSNLKRIKFVEGKRSDVP